MSYLATYRSSLGATASNKTVVSAIGKIIEDPALPTVLRLSTQIQRTPKSPFALAGAADTAQLIQKMREREQYGGLKTIVGPLKGFYYYRKFFPLVLAAGVAALGGVFYLGFQKGKKR